jgi:hypothetical protein
MGARERGSYLTSTGALCVSSGAKTGRARRPCTPGPAGAANATPAERARAAGSPKDKRVVAEPTSEGNVWWGPVNIKLDENAFMINREVRTRRPPARPPGAIEGAASRQRRSAHPARVLAARARLPEHARAAVRHRRLRRLGPGLPHLHPRRLRARVRAARSNRRRGPPRCARRALHGAPRRLVAPGTTRCSCATCW